MQLIKQPLLWLLAVRWYILTLALVALILWIYTILPPQVQEAFTATPADGPGLAKWNFSRQRAQPDLPDKQNNKQCESVYYIYWTGGFDSTYRLCEMLFDEGKIVQPIYITYALDNDCEKEETCNKLWVRRNREQEKKAMLGIRREIKKMDPVAADRLLPTQFVTKDLDDKEYTKWFEKQFFAMNIWPKKRKKHQYLGLAKWAAYHETYVDIGVVRMNDNSAITRFLQKNLEQIHCVCPNSGLLAPPAGINFQIRDKSHPMHYLRFPLWNRSKRDLMDHARLRRYDHILKMTWSCWFPDPKTKKACGKCPMCRERIIPQTVINGKL